MYKLTCSKILVRFDLKILDALHITSIASVC